MPIHVKLRGNFLPFSFFLVMKSFYAMHMHNRSGVAGLIIIILLLVTAAYLLGTSRSSVTQTPTVKPTMPTTVFPTPSVSATTTATLSITPTAPSEVSLTATGFVPTTLIITKGTTVTWINKSGADATVNSNPHPTHTDYPPLNLGTFPNGGTLSLSFPTTGTYGYHNHLNPSQRGTIIVR
ncbi:MAG: hypothetical protein KGJ07_04210 [Patescibacteria group bacterium]|nr:hypothetical protein [Patescibacteria group bacterium]